MPRYPSHQLPVRLRAMQVCPPSEADRVLDAMTGKGGDEVQKMADVIVVIYIYIHIYIYICGTALCNLSFLRIFVDVKGGLAQKFLHCA